MHIYEVREKYYTREWSSGKCREALIEHGLDPEHTLVAEFLGPGPMTEQEAAEYLAQECHEGVPAVDLAADRTPEQTRLAALASMLKEASREETSEWCQLIWDRQLELDITRLGTEEFQRRLEELDARKMDPLEALKVALEATQTTARKLAAKWIEREREQRAHPLAYDPSLSVTTRHSGAIRQCRRELQEAFHLVMSDAEVTALVEKNPRHDH